MYGRWINPLLHECVGDELIICYTGYGRWINLLLIRHLCLQVRSDYLRDVADHIDSMVAIQLGCIEMR